MILTLSILMSFQAIAMDDIFRVEDNVLLRDLKKKPELNGKFGKIKCNKDTKSNRYGVEVDSIGSLSILPTNLKKIPSNFQSAMAVWDMAKDWKISIHPSLCLDIRDDGVIGVFAQEPIAANEELFK